MITTIPYNYTPIHPNNQPFLEAKTVIPYIQPLKSDEYKIPTRYGIFDSKNYFTDWEIEQINESLSDYAAGNYKSGSLEELLADLDS